MAGYIDWKEYLNPEDVNVPLNALRYSCVGKISDHLIDQVQSSNDTRHMTNFEELGKLIGLDSLQISTLSRKANPGLEILESWKMMDILNPTVGNLVKYLAILGRRDVLTDCADWIRDEIAVYKQRQISYPRSPPRDVDQFLTVDDVENKRVTYYDGFVAYHKDNLDFVINFLDNLEDKSTYGLHFYMPGRNNLFGGNKYAIAAKIISQRCQHVIVILSRSFVQSPTCDFHTAIALCRNAGKSDRKIIPIIIEECEIPEELQFMDFCDLTVSRVSDNTWRQIALSLKSLVPNQESLGQVEIGERSSAVFCDFSDDQGYVSSTLIRGVSNTDLSSSSQPQSSNSLAHGVSQSDCYDSALPEDVNDITSIITTEDDNDITSIISTDDNIEANDLDRICGNEIVDQLAKEFFYLDTEG